MSDCCSPSGYRWVFSEKRAQADANRYRRRGLDPTSRRMAEIAKRRSLAGSTLLEIGGGIGAIQIELLRAGLSKAVSVELTPTFEPVARTLLHETGFEDRVERKVMDFVAVNGQVEPANLVIMNRVICCYPDMPALAGAAADHTRDVLLMSFPKERWWTRLGLGIVNLLLRVAGRQFHVFLHPPEAILATAEQHGLRTTLNESGLFWQIVAFNRRQGDEPPTPSHYQR